MSFRGWTIERSVNAREEERERGAEKDKEGLKRERVGGVMEVKLCEYEAITADVRRSKNLPNSPSGDL